MNKLFNDFSDISSKAWKQKIQVDLKGADYNDTLIWNSPEGIDVKPFYHSDSTQVTKPPNRTKNSWSICQTIYVTSESNANQKAIDAISRGAESIIFIVALNTISLKDLLQNIDCKKNRIHLDIQNFTKELVQNLIDYKTGEGIRVHVDIIGHLSKTGNWFQNLKNDHQLLEELINNEQNFDSILSVDMSLYQNAGATIMQQLAYGLAHANEYLNHFQDRSNTRIVFNVSVGTNYFFEIAKLRALRSLWHVLASEYNINSDCYIIATPSRRNKTIYDYNTNMLRTTTECMSAILGEADTINNLPYDAIYHKDNEFGNRVARNQLLVLKHESYFDSVNNASDGSYYIETLTQELSNKALELFKDIEANGGFLKQLKEGTIQRKIKESAQKEQERVANGTQVLLGTNKHPNPKDKMKHELELYPFIKTNKRKTIIEPILERRLAETIEQERLKTE